MKNFVRISTIEEVHKMLGIKKPNSQIQLNSYYKFNHLGSESIV